LIDALADVLRGIGADVDGEWRRWRDRLLLSERPGVFGIS
jgi:hypothetical protein